MTQPYPFTHTADIWHAKASAATRLRSSRLRGSIEHPGVFWWQGGDEDKPSAAAAPFSRLPARIADANAYSGSCPAAPRMELRR